MGIRPEGFVLDPEGPFTCAMTAVEVMGRDTSVVSSNPAMEGVSIRSIVPSDSVIDPEVKTVRFRLKPAKVHLFDAETEERIPVPSGKERAK